MPTEQMDTEGLGRRKLDMPPLPGLKNRPGCRRAALHVVEGASRERADEPHHRLGIEGQANGDGPVARAVLETSTLAPAELARLTMHNHTWYHITRYAGSFVAHNHPLASWSAVYCVRAGEAPADHPGSGLLRFLDTRAGVGSYLDAGNRSLRAPFAAGVREVRLEAGEIIVFPSYVIHEVSPFYGSDVRITVATNCWFV